MPPMGAGAALLLQTKGQTIKNSILISVLAAMCLLTACDNSEKSDSTPDSQAVTTTTAAYRKVKAAILLPKPLNQLQQLRQTLSRPHRKIL